MSDLYEIEYQPNESVIGYFEDLLARAKTGEIQGFAIVIEKKSATTANGWTGLRTNCMSIIGEIECMKVDLINSNVDQRYDCHGNDVLG